MSRLRRLLVTGKIFFITCNLRRTRTELTANDFQALADAILRVRERRQFLVAGYVFMPDHWHLIVVPAPADTLPKLMDALKVASARGINGSRHAQGPVWQSRFYDRAIRNVKEYLDTVAYLHLNPVRKGLVRKPEDWLWSSVHSFGGRGPIRLRIDRLDLPANQATPL